MDFLRFQKIVHNSNRFRKEMVAKNIEKMLNLRQFNTEIEGKRDENRKNKLVTAIRIHRNQMRKTNSNFVHWETLTICETEKHLPISIIIRLK